MEDFLVAIEKHWFVLIFFLWVMYFFIKSIHDIFKND